MSMNGFTLSCGEGLANKRMKGQGLVLRVLYTGLTHILPTCRYMLKKTAAPSRANSMVKGKK